MTSLADPPTTRDTVRFLATTVHRRPVNGGESPVEELGAGTWHRAGFRGQGVKVAILDSGFRGYAATLGTVLPRRVTAKSFRVDGDLEARDSQHGIYCAEVVHSLAPEAELLLANWEPDSPESFLRAVAWAKGEGARIATCSVVMPSWSDGAGGGATHAALRGVVGTGDRPGDLLLTAAAGNLAQRHWAGVVQSDPRGHHLWRPGQTLNGIQPWGSERVAVEVYGAVPCPCRLEIHDRRTGRILHEAEFESTVDGEPRTAGALRFEPSPGVDYAVALRVRGASAGRFHLVVLGGQLETSSPADSIPFPGDGTHVLTLGCVDGFHQRIAYSSCGPTSPRPKPDLTARVPFPLRLRSRPFEGTSAAAPQAAALAALVLSRHPSSSPDAIRTLLHRSALDLADPGFDPETGHGLLRLP